MSMPAKTRNPAPHPKPDLTARDMAEMRLVRSRPPKAKPANYQSPPDDPAPPEAA
ncbi:hypothetical protein MU852_04095 [Brevundimonas albigilva]|uniref:hypothetical protein n=1 Tax=Brevundimonas albigilva TaxID=1312364 RepID=UPI00201B8BA2|nr:hypothetical protein [Brevundimonas albigilva]UQV19052.1 hypothetical protein MU852_04095 [Brevundimonas albigilva]